MEGDEGDDGTGGGGGEGKGAEAEEEEAGLVRETCSPITESSVTLGPAMC